MLTPFLEQQRKHLLELREIVLASRSGADIGKLYPANEPFAQKDDGSYSHYDRDFTLNLLATIPDSLNEIEEALKRIDDGTYGICEMCHKSIPHDRLEALPFSRLTTDCQGETETALWMLNQESQRE
jgi:RNA polymerase-binding transcription factor DksA